MRNKNVTTEFRRQQMLEYNSRNMKKILEYQSKYKTEKVKNDPLYRLMYQIKCHITKCIKDSNWRINSKLGKIVGLSKRDYIKHIESTWQKGMSWDNYGREKGSWSIDHIKPLSTAMDEEELLKRFHYTNTRAIWQIDNIRKSNSEE